MRLGGNMYLEKKQVSAAAPHISHQGCSHARDSLHQTATHMRGIRSKGGRGVERDGAIHTTSIMHGAANGADERSHK